MNCEVYAPSFRPPAKRFSDAFSVQIFIEPERNYLNYQKQHDLDKEVIADWNERKTASGDNGCNERNERQQRKRR